MIEELHQKKLVQYLKILKSQKRIIEFYATINENKHSFSNRQMALRIESKAKSLGKRSGVSDLTIIARDKIYFIELKIPPKILKNGEKSYSNSKVSNKQKEFITTVNQSNVVDAVVCHGYEDAKLYVDNFILKD